MLQRIVITALKKRIATTTLCKFVATYMNLASGNCRFQLRTTMGPLFVNFFGIILLSRDQRLLLISVFEGILTSINSRQLCSEISFHSSFNQTTYLSQLDNSSLHDDATSPTRSSLRLARLLAAAICLQSEASSICSLLLNSSLGCTSHCGGTSDDISCKWNSDKHCFEFTCPCPELLAKIAACLHATIAVDGVLRVSVAATGTLTLDLDCVRINGCDCKLDPILKAIVIAVVIVDTPLCTFTAVNTVVKVTPGGSSC